VSSIRQSLIISFAEKYSALAITIGSTLLLARLLTPEDTGLYSVAAGLINLAQLVRDFGIGNYIVQEEDLTPSRWATAVGISIALATIIGGGFALAAPVIATLFHEPRLCPVILVMSLNFIGVAFATIGFARLRRDMDFTSMLRIGIATTVVHATASVVLASHGYGALGMAWASVLNVATTLVGLSLCGPRGMVVMPALGEWRRLVTFGMFTTAGQVLQGIGERSPDLVIGRILGVGQAGLFSRGNSLITLFEQALIDAITPVTHTGFAQLNRANQDLRQPFLRSLGYTTAVAWPVLGLMSLLAHPIFLVMFGSQWMAAVPTGQVLCLAGAAWVVGRLCGSLLNATGSVRRLFRLQMLSTPFQLAALIIGAMISLKAAAMGVVIGSVLQSSLTLHQANQVVGAHWRAIAATLARSAAVTIATLAVPVMMVPADASWLGAVTCGAAGLASWLLWIFMGGHPLRDEIRAILARS
jgi:O-antigen/teichoic acid export membrane protein